LKKNMNINMSVIDCEKKRIPVPLRKENMVHDLSVGS